MTQIVLDAKTAEAIRQAGDGSVELLDEAGARVGTAQPALPSGQEPEPGLPNIPLPSEAEAERLMANRGRGISMDEMRGFMAGLKAATDRLDARGRNGSH